IDRRHGVEHGEDPRVYSIGAFKEEWERIEKEREDSFFSRQAILLSDPDVDPSDLPERGGFYRRLTDCEACISRASTPTSKSASSTRTPRRGNTAKSMPIGWSSAATLVTP